MNKSVQLDAHDNFTRYHSQTRALLMSLGADESFQSLPPADVSAVIWLAVDRLDDMRQAHDALAQAIRGGDNG